MKRVGLYIRVSTADQTTDLQKRELIQYADARGWDYLVFEDKATGTSDKRQALQLLQRAARQREVDIVACWKLDRFFRSLKHLVQTLQEFQELGVTFVALKDQIDLTTSSGRLMLHIIGAFAEFEASLCRERVRSGLAAAKSRGVKLGRRRTHDYQYITQLRREGLTYREIGGRLGVSQGTISTALRAARKTPEDSRS